MCFDRSLCHSAPTDFALGSQLPQTGYQALYTPYAFLGLGRTNNYIESLTVGSTSPRSATTLEGVIPNSKLVLNPGPDGADWRRELFLRPGEWLWWVLITLVGATILLLLVVFVLHINEKVNNLILCGASANVGSGFLA